MNKKSTIKSIGGALLLTVIGTALWEHIVSPLFSFLSIEILSFFASISNNLSASIYTDVSSGFNETSSNSLLTFAQTFLICYFIYQLRRFFLLGKHVSTNTPSSTNQEEPYLIDSMGVNSQNKRLQEDIRETSYLNNNAQTIKKQNIRWTVIMIIITTITVSTLGLSLIKNNYVNYLKTTMLSNIEIVSPYISPTEYMSLKSDFYQVRCKKDYDVISSKLKEIGCAKKLKLKE